MNSNEATELIRILQGAYPGTYFDGPVAEAFGNSFITNDYDASAQAVQEWVNTMDRFPTIAELNRTIRRIKGTAEEGERVLARPDEPVDVKVAAAAFERGYRQARGRLGETDDQIDEKLAVYLRKFPGSVLGVNHARTID